MDMSGMDQSGQAAAGGYMNRWYDGSEGGHSGLHQDYYNSMAQAMHCAYGNNMAGMYWQHNFFYCNVKQLINNRQEAFSNGLLGLHIFLAASYTCKLPCSD